MIFLSAFAETVDKVKAFSLGAVDYVTKPFQADEIEARVRTHLKMRSLQRQLLRQNERLEGLVAERTRELTQAYGRLQELDTLKDDFLRMISHEVRTPAAGVLGVGELLLDLCPVSAERTHYQTLFHSCSARLLQLIEDATLIADGARLTAPSSSVGSLTALFAAVQSAPPGPPDLGGSTRHRARDHPPG